MLQEPYVWIYPLLGLMLVSGWRVLCHWRTTRATRRRIDLALQLSTMPAWSPAIQSALVTRHRARAPVFAGR